MKVEVEAGDLMAILGPAVSYAEHELNCEKEHHRVMARELYGACHRCAQAVAQAVLEDPPPELQALLRVIMGEPPGQPVPPAGKAAKNPADPRSDTPPPPPVGDMTREQLEAEAGRLGVPNPVRMNIANLREYVEAARHRGAGQ